MDLALGIFACIMFTLCLCCIGFIGFVLVAVSWRSLNMLDGH